MDRVINNLLTRLLPHGQTPNINNAFGSYRLKLENTNSGWVL